MRRALASLLIAVLSFPLIAATLFAGDSPTLAACCRRGGKHHCEMAVAAPGDGPAISAARCPSWPKSASALSASQAFSAAPAIVPASRLAAHGRVAQPVSRRGYSISIASLRKRGPPSRLA
ncbi:MAG TPA: hypothetical protein VKX39_14075 [Bryobacteraceae bacterium]|jgi:hypothetical protein|nr:hypothetical protein [Bryobacteraceae bacterium]